MKEELVIRECQDLETHLNRTRDFTGSLFSMSGMISSGSSGVGVGVGVGASISDCVLGIFVKKLIRVRLHKANGKKWKRPVWWVGLCLSLSLSFSPSPFSL